MEVSPVTEDGIFDVYLPEVLSFSDYYPFHMQMPNRYGATDEYRYGGANGQESESEITGNSSHYSAEYWMYDSRLGRRWNVDPVVKSYESPYATLANNPLWFTDPLGDNPLVRLFSIFRRFQRDAARFGRNRRNLEKLRDAVDFLDFAISFYQLNQESTINGETEKIYRDSYNDDVKPLLKNEYYYEPRNLNEHMAMQAAKSGQGEATSMASYFNAEGKFVDKYSYTHKTADGKMIEIHYEVDVESGEKYNFKYIDGDIRAENNKIKSEFRKKAEMKAKQEYNDKIKNLEKEKDKKLKKLFRLRLKR